MNSLSDKKIKASMSKAKVQRLPAELFVTNLQFEDEIMLIFLKNGYVMPFHLDEFPRLKKATAKQRDDWELISNGIGIHWEDLDKDISVEGLIKSYMKHTATFNKKVEKLLAA